MLKRRHYMDVMDYCKGVEMELVSWKAKLYDMIRKLDKMGTAEREKILPNVEDLHMLLADMEERVAKLKSECPSEWSPAKKEIDEGHVDMRSKYEETLASLGKAAPVSVPG